MFISFNQFVKSEYEARCDNDVVKKCYQKAGGLKAFKRQYITYNGFSDYLKAIQGTQLTAIQTYHLARLFYVYGKRSPSTLPNVLNGIARQYNIEYPAVYGILSKAYWQSRFDDVLMH